MLTPLVLMGCSYDPPLRPDAPEVDNVIHGSVVLTGIDEPSTVVVVVSNADDPGPPDGTGLPVTIASVHADSFNKVEGGWASSYTVSGLPDGTWLLDGLMDVDGDFSPGPSGLAGATCGDWGGMHLSNFGAAERGSVTVKGGEYVDNVTIVVDTFFDTERPAFEVRGGFPAMNLQDGTEELIIQEYFLKALAVHTSYDGRVKDAAGPYDLDLTGPCARFPDEDANFHNFCDPALSTCDTAFWIMAVDADGDGVVDPHPDHDPALGVKDIWPRVYLRYLGVPDRNGAGDIILENGNPTITPPGKKDGLKEGEYWGSENFVFGLEARTALPLELNTPTPANTLKVAWAPAIAHFYPTWNDDCVGEPPADRNVTCQGPNIDIRDADIGPEAIPAGLWEINVISYTGQTWMVPNEIALEELPARQGFVSASQGGAILTE